MKKAIALSILLLTQTIVAATVPPSPVPMLRKVADDLLGSLRQQRNTLQHNPRIVYGLVHKILLPHVDLQSMSRSALGRTAWQKATPAQRQAFTQAFTDLVVRTYGSALTDYDDEKIEFLPLRDTLTPDTRRVQVSTVIIRKAAPKIPVLYRLVYRQPNWLVYDFSVEGISMVASFRAQFADSLSQHGSIDRLTTKIKHHNQKN